MSVRELAWLSGTAETKPGAALVRSAYEPVRARAGATIRRRVSAAIREGGSFRSGI
ncbi:MAG: hypothetical protein ACRDOG_04740 [Gaiellaceae bacterium]